jgi:hypothetical protein
VAGLRRLHNEKLHNVYVPSNIIWVIMPRRLRLVEHTAHMGEMINACINLVGKT